MQKLVVAAFLALLFGIASETSAQAAITVIKLVDNGPPQIANGLVIGISASNTTPAISSECLVFFDGVLGFTSFDMANPNPGANTNLTYYTGTPFVHSIKMQAINESIGQPSNSIACNVTITVQHP